MAIANFGGRCECLLISPVEHRGVIECSSMFDISGANQTPKSGSDNQEHV